MKKNLHDFIQENREAFDTREPDPAVLLKIQQRLQKTQSAKKPGALVIPIRMVRWAAACLILLAGAAVFWVSREKENTNLNVAVTKPVTPPHTNAPENSPLVTKENTQSNAVAVAANETHKMNVTAATDIAERKQVLFAKLNDMESPSARLQAASLAAAGSRAGKDIVDALVHTMNNDPSSNVRLAAMEGLGKFYREPYVRKKLIESLKKQKDPLVQIGLIDLLTKMKESTIINELDRIVKDGTTLEAVKDHSYSGMLTLRS